MRGLMMKEGEAMEVQTVSGDVRKRLADLLNAKERTPLELLLTLAAEKIEKQAQECDDCKRTINSIGVTAEAVIAEAEQAREKDRQLRVLARAVLEPNNTLFAISASGIARKVLAKVNEVSKNTGETPDEGADFFVRLKKCTDMEVLKSTLRDLHSQLYYREHQVEAQWLKIDELVKQSSAYAQQLRDLQTAGEAEKYKDCQIGALKQCVEERDAEIRRLGVQLAEANRKISESRADKNTEAAAEPKKLPEALEHPKSITQVWMIADLSETEPTRYGGERLPLNKAPRFLHYNQDEAENELLRLTQRHPCGAFVLLQAVAWARPVQNINYRIERLGDRPF